MSKFKKLPGALPPLVLLLTLVLMSGCGHETDNPEGNASPFVRITGGPLDGDTDSYTAQIFWTGWDEDGVITRYEYAIDPPIDFTNFEIAHPESASSVTSQLIPGPEENSDTLRVSKVNDSGDVVTFDWVQTLEFTRAFAFSTPNPDSALNEPTRTYFGAHTIYVRAVDNEDAYSEFDRIAYTATTITPEAIVRTPDITGEITNLGSTLTLTWDGIDPDSPEPSKKPTGYLYKVLRLDTLVPSVPLIFVTDPNILYTKWNEGVDSVWTYQDADTLRKTFFLGVPGTYLFGIRAVDVAGGEEPFLEFGRNSFKFQALPQGGRPSLTVSEPTVGAFSYVGDLGVNEVEVPTGRILRFNWFASAETYGGAIDGYSYGLDIPDLDVEGPNSGWSGWGPITGNVDPIVFNKPGIHVVYVRARDDAGTITLATLVLRVIEFAFDREVLFVDDVRDNTFPSDVQHDNFWANKFANYPGFGANDVFVFSSHSPPTSDVESLTSPRNMSLEEMGRYKIIVWENAGWGFNGVSQLYNATVRSPKIAAYVGAQGKLWLGGRMTAAATWRTPPAAVFADFAYPKEMRERDFLYDFLKLHTDRIDNAKGDGSNHSIVEVRPFPGRPAVYDSLHIDKSKLNAVQARLGGATHADAVIDPNFAGNEPGFTGVLDSLYIYGAAGDLDREAFPSPVRSSYNGKLVAVRWSDPDVGREHGRVQWFGFPLYYFMEEETQQVFNKSLNWFREEEVGIGN